MTNYEIEFLNKIRQSIPVFFDKLFKLITNLGGQEILILVILVVYFVFSKKNRTKTSLYNLCLFAI